MARQPIGKYAGLLESVLRRNVIEELARTAVASNLLHARGYHRDSTGSECTTSPLLSHIRTKIMMRGGPISMSEYMQDCLTSPQGGFYMNRDVFGRAGDFITSPEISQLFGEMVGIWCVHTWMALGRPRRLMLVEMGPGRGTLMADLLRGTAVFREFAASLEVHLVEVSPALRGLQWAALRCAPLRADNTGQQEQREQQGEQQQQGQERQGQERQGQQGQQGQQTSSSSGAAPADSSPAPRTAGVCGLNGCKVFWHPTLDAVPDGPAPALYVAHEFFDALPVHQFVRDPVRGWLEKMVDVVPPEEESKEAPEARPVSGLGSGPEGREAVGMGSPGAVVRSASGSCSDASGSAGSRGDLAAPSSRASDSSSSIPRAVEPAVMIGTAGERSSSSRAGDQRDEPCSSTSSTSSTSSPAHTTSGSGLRLVLSPGPTPAAALLVPRRLAGLAREEAERTKALEVCAVGMATAERLAQRIARHGGAALVVDYGREGPPYEDSLMAIRGHKGVGILDDPGSADLSAWVDFGALRLAAQGAERPAGSVPRAATTTIITGSDPTQPAASGSRPAGSVIATSGPVTQAAFLRALGIETRLQWLASRARNREEVEALAAGCARLLGESGEGGMGTSYKVMAVHHADLRELAGFT